MAVDQLIIDRFLEKVVPVTESGCWLWAGAAQRTGYGNFWNGKRYECSHRASYRMFVGDIPDGLWVLHKCDVPCCVNPWHLFLGTPKDNSMDMASKGRNRNGCKTVRGIKHPFAKLTDEQVIAIKQSTFTNKQTALKFGINESTVERIKSGRAWAHIDVESKKGRGKAYGERHHKAKLTSQIVQEIRDLAAGGRSGGKLASQFGVHKSTIYKIISGEIWT